MECPWPCSVQGYSKVIWCTCDVKQSDLLIILPVVIELPLLFFIEDIFLSTMFSFQRYT